MARTRRFRLLLLPLIVLLLAVACEPVVSRPARGPRPGPDSGSAGRPASIGQVRADAPVVSVNGRPVTGTVPLSIGDDVQTDASGRATILLDAGGYLVIGPNTDPLFQLVGEAGCVATNVLLQVIIQRGTFDFFNVTRVCFCDVADAVCGVPSSDFRVVITSSGASIAVSRGALQATVGRPPQQRQYRVEQGQGMMVVKGRTGGPRPIVR